ncbi:MAG: AfsR/SARP family transcriptional regulator [Gaiellaceae bacterium]
MTALQVRVSRLRKSLEASGEQPPIVTRAPGYLVQVDTEQLDLLRFERLAAQAHGALGKGDPETAAERLRQALALWSGPALADLTYEPFAQAAIVRLEELRLAALEQRIEVDLALGRHADVAGELEALVAEHPLRERLRRQLMRPRRALPHDLGFGRDDRPARSRHSRAARRAPRGASGLGDSGRGGLQR